MTFGEQKQKLIERGRFFSNRCTSIISSQPKDRTLYSKHFSILIMLLYIEIQLQVFFFLYIRTKRSYKNLRMFVDCLSFTVNKVIVIVEIFLLRVCSNI